MTLLDAIPHGRPATKAEIAARLGVSTRDVERAIEEVRKAGQAAIASDARGYWQPASSAEYAANIANRRRRALSQLVTVRGERRFAKRWAAREALPLAFQWEAA